MYRLIDTHAHLDEIAGLADTLAAARSAGVVAIIGVGSDYQSNRKILQIARTYSDFVYPALGLHPWNIKDAGIDGSLAFIEANMDKAVAVGEIGLDYHKKVRAVADKALQQYVLRELLKIAAKHHKPALIHSRYAWRDAFNLVEQAQLEKVVFHWYTGPSSVLRDIVARGYYLSATPAVEYHEEHRRAIKEAPLERLLLETDAPVVYRRGSEFEYESRPGDVLRTLKSVADLKRLNEADVAAVTTDNARQLFSL